MEIEVPTSKAPGPEGFTIQVRWVLSKVIVRNRPYDHWCKLFGNIVFFTLIICLDCHLEVVVAYFSPFVRCM